MNASLAALWVFLAVIEVFLLLNYSPDFYLVAVTESSAFDFYSGEFRVHSLILGFFFLPINLGAMHCNQYLSSSVFLSTVVTLTYLACVISS